MQPDRNAVDADFSPFPGLAAIAEVLDLHRAVDDQRTAKGHAPGLHHAPQQGRRPIRTDHLALRQTGAGVLHHLPAGGLGEQCFGEFNGHRRQYAHPRPR